jgi:hypothetical protein
MAAPYSSAKYGDVEGHWNVLLMVRAWTALQRSPRYSVVVQRKDIKGSCEVHLHSYAGDLWPKGAAR